VNRRCRMRGIYVSVCKGTFLDKTHLSMDRISCTSLFVRG
jgi:hypothetical protein